MKNCLITVLAVLAIAAACTHKGSNGTLSKVDRAETAFAQGRYVRSQAICDSLVLGSNFGSLNVDELCRLSMLFMRLGENSGDEGVNTAMAARCISAAIARDSDSTATAIRAMPSEDRARAIILSALNDAGQRAENPDSLIIPADSIPDNEL